MTRSSLPPVWILGGAQTDFARHWAREAQGIGDMLADAVTSALADAALDACAIEAVHVGNFVSASLTGQSHLGGIIAEHVPGLRGVPASRHEAACASGSMALLAATADIRSGRYDSVLVVGAEMMRNVPGERAAACLAAAAWQGHEAQHARYCWPHLFHQVCEEYDRRHGLDYRHLGAIAAQNIANARRNPLAQTRQWQFSPSAFEQDDIANPVIDGWIRRNDCGQVTDGAACVILAGESTARRWATAHGMTLSQVPRILGEGHRTARMSLQGKFEDSRQDALLFPHLRATIDDALRRAALPGIEAIDALETHDCFAVSEYVALDHLGIRPPGQAWQLVEEGWIGPRGTLPVNPSGGLIGAGHPVGATGVRMVHDAARQVSDQAGEMQVEGARRVMTLNIGGSFTTVASFIVGTDA